MERGKEDKQEMINHVGGISEELGGVDPEADATLMRLAIGA